MLFIESAPSVRPPFVVVFISVSAVVDEQFQAIINVMRACAGLAPENHMLLEHRLASEIDARDSVSLDL